MENSKLVSCIITTYNRPNLVGRAIESVLNQSYKNIEIILVDDHSSESYAPVIEKYKNDPRLTYSRNSRNLRLSASRNVGIGLAKGEFIAFLDDDDTWLPSKLQKQVSFLNNNSEYVACTSTHIESVSKETSTAFKTNIYLEDNLGFNHLGPPSKILVRKEIATVTSFDTNSNHAEDWDFYLRILTHGPIHVFEEPLIIYDTVHFGRMTTGFSTLSIGEIKEKANMTIKNKELIGESNFKMRMASYYLSGFFKRKGKMSHLYKVQREVGLTTVLKSLFKKLKKGVSK
ncbi:glycosyltransferase family A protein [uncultured Alteromonas sp.]|uniref:glycosyltransferase family 2 protein n=1 Tax=uncultured Alteromonas sp. TaxID=179113 RepID=UPI0030DA92FE